MRYPRFRQCSRLSSPWTPSSGGTVAWGLAESPTEWWNNAIWKAPMRQMPGCQLTCGDTSAPSRSRPRGGCDGHTGVDRWGSSRLSDHDRWSTLGCRTSSGIPILALHNGASRILTFSVVIIHRPRDLGPGVSRWLCFEMPCATAPNREHANPNSRPSGKLLFRSFCLTA